MLNKIICQLNLQYNLGTWKNNNKNYAQIITTSEYWLWISGQGVRTAAKHSFPSLSFSNNVNTVWCTSPLLSFVPHLSPRLGSPGSGYHFWVPETPFYCDWPKFECQLKPVKISTDKTNFQCNLYCKWLAILINITYFLKILMLAISFFTSFWMCVCMNLLIYLDPSPQSMWGGIIFLNQFKIRV